MDLLRELWRRAQHGSDISDHLPRLFELASVPHVKVIELGVRSGDSTSAFLAAAQAVLVVPDVAELSSLAPVLRLQDTQRPELRRQICIPRPHSCWRSWAGALA